jgi:hypothetical protein
VFKLSSDGGSLFYSTYIGGSNPDLGYEIALDSLDNAYVMGDTNSIDFPILNAYSTMKKQFYDVFVLKLIEDKNNPNLDSPSDLVYVQGTTGNQINWTVGDMSPDQYRVDGNGTTVGWTPWSNGSIIIDVDGFIPSVYNHTITVVDGWGHEVKDTVFVIVVPDTISPDLSSPSDIVYIQGVTGNQINWFVGDINPHQYRVDGNGSTIDWTAWSNGSIIVNVDGFTPGVYNHTIIVIDNYDNEAKDTVFVTVIPDIISPDLASPSDFSYEQGVTGNLINWTVGDINPYQYRVDGNGTTVEWTPWSNGSIVIDVDGLTLGVYNYTITIQDNFENYAVDTVFVTVVDTTPPTIDQPIDIQYELGTTGNTITWSPSDLNPATYEIMKNGTVVDSGDWNDETINITVDDLSTGTYNYTIVVFDQAGNSVSDTVIVRVFSTTTTSETPTTSTTTPPDYTFAILMMGGAAGVFIVIVVIILKKRSN